MCYHKKKTPKTPRASPLTKILPIGKIFVTFENQRNKGKNWVGSIGSSITAIAIMPLHPKTREATKEITKTILAIVGMGGVTLLAMQNPATAYRMPAALAVYSARRIRQTIARLRLQGYIRFDPRDAAAPITLTKKGMERMARLTFRDLLKGKRRWDYLWRMVMFDVPERLRHVRVMLQYEFSAAGFYPLQKSIFVCPYPCEKEVMEFCRVKRARPFVIFATTASLGKDEPRVRKFFFGRRRGASFYFRGI